MYMKGPSISIMRWDDRERATYRYRISAGESIEYGEGQFSVWDLCNIASNISICYTIKP